MTFFATSTGSGDKGGDLGGLAGADARCQTLATAVGAGDHTWHAYLSTNTNNGGTLVHAKDRIGAGPWKNQKKKVIAKSVAELHGAAFNILGADILDEKGAKVPNNRHDIMTGTNADGTATANNNCANWTSSTSNNGAYVGHSDSDTTANSTTDKWNNAHPNNQANGNAACSSARIAAQAGEGRVYCFAID
jgi:hypothetical protein